MSDPTEARREAERRAGELRAEAQRLEEAAEKLGALAEGVNESLGRRFFLLFLQAAALYLLLLPLLGLVVYAAVRLALKRTHSISGASGFPTLPRHLGSKQAKRSRRAP
jgi:hypothetical protein